MIAYEVLGWIWHSQQLSALEAATVALQLTLTLNTEGVCGGAGREGDTLGTKTKSLASSNCTLCGNIIKVLM